MLFSVCTSALLPAEQPVQSKNTINAGAALRSLERAVALLVDSRWEDASFEARLGSTYDPLLADFPYIEALSLAGRGSPRADILERLEASLVKGLSWRSYDRRDAVRFCARLYAETLRYRDALALLGTDDGELSADGDHVRLLALYGLGQREEAIRLAKTSLERWPFDSRFAEVCLRRETGHTKDPLVTDVIETILSRLYLWQEQNPVLLLLAVPYERSAPARERNIRMYRNMLETGEAPASTRVLSTVLALEYGLVSEKQALDELLRYEDEGIPRDVLLRLSELLVDEAVRREFLEKLNSFGGILVHDDNSDGILDARIRYRMGRPVYAEFDIHQSGYPEIRVTAELGDPVLVVLDRDTTEIRYDTYPVVNSVRRNNRQYTLRPQALSWAPVRWIRDDSIPDGFFYLVPNTAEVPLTERMLIASSLYYAEPVEDTPAGETRYVLENSMPVMSEQRVDGQTLSRTTYKAGKPVSTNKDANGDGYFETRMTYHPDTTVASIEIDRNANRTYEYREEYTVDGSVVKKWDYDEDGVYETEWEMTAQGKEQSRWIHPVSGQRVEVVMENGQPRSVLNGTTIQPVVPDTRNDIQWIGRIPVNSPEVARKILECLNRDDVAVVCSMMKIESSHYAVVRTGGFVFVELLDAE